jgi:hypothetical protein
VSEFYPGLEVVCVNDDFSAFPYNGESYPTKGHHYTVRKIG